MKRRVNFRGLSLVVLAAATWGMSGFFIHGVLDGSEISAWSLAFWREASTAVSLFLGLRLFRPNLLVVKRQDLPWLALMGMVSIGLFHGMWNMSVVINGTAVATVLQYNAPLFVTLAAWLWWQEPLTGRKLSAIGLALGGTVLVTGFDWQTGSQISVQGGLVGLGTAVAFSGLSLFGKKLAGDYNPWTILFYTFTFGALALLPFQWGRPFTPPDSLPAFAAFAGLVYLSTISGFACYTTSLNYLQASVAIIVATVEVPFAALVSNLLLKEKLDAWQILGAALVVSGVIILSWPPKANPQMADNWQLEIEN